MDMKTHFSSVFNSEDPSKENSSEPKLTITYHLQNDDSERSKLFVGGLSWETTQETLKSFFSRYGEVVDCVVMKNQETGRSRGFGFITYKDPSCVETVLAAGPHNLDGRTIDPKACNPRSMQKPKNKENRVRKIFIGGLPSNCTETDLTNFFSQYGKVTEVVIMYDQQKQRSRGFGFLSFESEDSVERVIGEHYVSINGKQIECKRAEPRDNKMGKAWGSPAMGPMGTMPNGMPGQIAAGTWGQQAWGAPPQGFPPQGPYGPPPPAPPFQSWGSPGAPGFGSFPPPPGPFGPPPPTFGAAEGIPDDMSALHSWSTMNNGAPTSFAFAGYGVPPPVPVLPPPAVVTSASDVFSAATAGITTQTQLASTPVAVSTNAATTPSTTVTAVAAPVPPPTVAQPPKSDYSAYSTPFGTMGSYAQETSTYGPARAFSGIQDGLQTPTFGAFGVPMPTFGQSDPPFGTATTGTSTFGVRTTSQTQGYHPYRR